MDQALLSQLGSQEVALRGESKLMLIVSASGMFQGRARCNLSECFHPSNRYAHRAAKAPIVAHQRSSLNKPTMHLALSSCQRRNKHSSYARSFTVLISKRT